MNINPAIYLDYNATTPVAPEVVNEMLPHFLTAYGNPSSNDHILGWQAKEAVEEARKAIADGLDALSEEIIFTAGATEALNMVLRGLNNVPGSHVITLKTEHNAVLDTCAVLEKTGTEVSYLDVDDNGIISLKELEDTIRPETSLACIMMVNNETGVVQPIKEIAEICHKKGILLMSDTTQIIGKMPVSASELGVDILTGSAHKFYGPNGVGFLYINKSIIKDLSPIITGGGQEGKKRAGTVNVPGIVGMAKAFTLANELHTEDRVRIESLRNHFENKLEASLEIGITGKYANRLYNCSNICFKNADSEQIMLAIGSKVAASRGSACSSGKIEPSHVLSAMGIKEIDALGCIRFSFGRYTTIEEVDSALDIITAAVRRLKA
jgi:cysteine desulfurase